MRKKLIKQISFLMASLILIITPLSVKASTNSEVSIGGSEDGYYSLTIPVAVELNTDGEDTIVPYSINSDLEPYKFIVSSIYEKVKDNKVHVRNEMMYENNKTGKDRAYEKITMPVYSKDMLQAKSVDVLNSQKYIFGGENFESSFVFKTSQVDFDKGEYFIPFKTRFYVRALETRAPGLYELTNHSLNSMKQLLSWDELTNEYSYNPEQKFTHTNAQNGVEGTLLWALKKYQTDTNYRFQLNNSNKSYRLILSEDVTQLQDCWLTNISGMSIEIIMPRNDYTYMSMANVQSGYFAFLGIMPKSEVMRLSSLSGRHSTSLITNAYFDYGNSYFGYEFEYDRWNVDTEILMHKNYINRICPSTN